MCRLLAGHHKVLQVKDRHPSFVSAHIAGRVFSRHIHPTGIDFGIQKLCGDPVIKVIKAVFAVGQPYKFKIMVVIHQVNAVFRRFLCQKSDIFHGFIVIFLARPVLFSKIGNSNTGTADFLVGRKDFIGIGKHFRKRNMSGNRCQTVFPAEFPDLCPGFSEQPGEFHALVAHFRNFFQRFLKVLLHSVSYRVELKRNRKFFQFLHILPSCSPRGISKIGHFLPVHLYYTIKNAIIQEARWFFPGQILFFEFQVHTGNPKQDFSDRWGGKHFGKLPEIQEQRSLDFSWGRPFFAFSTAQGSRVYVF